MPRVIQGEVAGLGLGPLSLKLFLNNTKEFRIQIAGQASGIQGLKK